jgi:hypothetical protein
MKRGTTLLIGEIVINLVSKADEAFDFVVLDSHMENIEFCVTGDKAISANVQEITY